MNSKKNLSDTNDSIFIENMEVACRLGTTPEERAFPQVIFLNIKMYLSLKKAGATDDLNQTIDYADIVTLVKNHLESNIFHLVESAAESTANNILKNKLIKAVEIRVAKKIFSNVERIGAQIFRTQN